MLRHSLKLLFNSQNLLLCRSQYYMPPQCNRFFSVSSDGDSPIKHTKKRQRAFSSSSEEENVIEKSVKKTKIASKLSQFTAKERTEEVKTNGKEDKKLSPKASPTKEVKSPSKEKEEKTNGKEEKKLSPKASPTKEVKSPFKEKKASPKAKNAAKKKVSPKAKVNGSAAVKVKTEDVKDEEIENGSPVKSAEEQECSPKKSLKVEEEEIESKPKVTPPKKGISSFFTSSVAKKESSKEEEQYNPAATKYNPIKDAFWKKGEKVPYLALSKTLQEIEGTSGRLKMIDILSNYLRSVLVLSPEDFLPSIYLCLNKIGPAYEGLELGLAEQTLIRVISQSTGRTFTHVKKDIQEVGDLGLVAEKSRSAQRLMMQPQPLTVRGIFQKFREFAAMTGKSSVNQKVTMIQGLFVACRGPEARYLIRSLNGKMRIGLAEQSVLQAIAQACATTPPCQSYPPEVLNASRGLSAESFKSRVDELALVLKTTYCECPNYDMIVPVILREGINALPKHCKITPGIPVKPMLAQPTKGVQEVLTRFDGLDFTCEWKYDGERAQIHGLEDGSIKIYSRNQENNTSKYPDIINRIKEARGDDVKSFILDCEAVAWDCTDKRILPFQILSTRKRKDANEAEIKVQVCVFMFDLLYLNEQALVRKTLEERRRLLHENFKEVEGQWKFATAIDTCKMEEVQEFLEESIKGQCEGLMVKTLKEEATYEIAKRSRNWLKLKKDYLEGVGDTLDLVVMGGYIGKGKRTGTYGGFLIGCYDEDNEEYQTLCKIGTGFSDEDLQTHTQFFKDHLLPKAPSYYQSDSSLAPDNWFAPVQVWEIKCADLSLSPIHRAALGLIDPDKGISLRFPRFLRIRDDKKPEEATSARQVADMYSSQEQVQAQKKTTTFNEEDFY